MRRPDRSVVALALVAALAAPMAVAVATGGAAGAYVEEVVAEDAGDCKGLADVNGDGLVDVIVGDQLLHWYEAPSWDRHLMGTADLEFTTDCQTADVDGDGDVDVVVPDGTPGRGNLYWFENSGLGSFTRRLIGNSGYRHDVEVADLTGDGRVDVAVRRIGDLTVFHQDGNGGWGSRRLSTRGGEGTALGDVDGDGWVDIVLGGHWLRNPGSVAGTWQERTIVDTEWASIAVGDVDLDGRADVVLGPMESTGNELAWYSTADPLAGPWARHVIDSGTGAGYHTHELADVDLDGRLDLVTGKMAGGLWAYLNRADGWVKQLASTGNVHNPRVADVNGDGVPDVLAVGFAGNPPARLVYGPPPAPTTTLPPPSSTTSSTSAPTTTSTTAPTSTTAAPTTSTASTTTTAPTTTTTSPMPEGTTVTVAPSGDAHVRDGGSASTNFGASPTVDVKTDSVYGYTRQGYVVFPLPPGPVPERAVLRLEGRLQKGSLGLAAHQVAGVPDEATLTWANRPPLGAQLASTTITGTARQVIELDVTAAVASARQAGADSVALGLRATTSGEPKLEVVSREGAGSGALGPQLRLTVPGDTPTTTTPPTTSTTTSTTTTTATTTTTTTAPPSTTTTTSAGPPTGTTTTTVTPTVVSVVATADAHVRNGGSAGTNFGTAPLIEVKTDSVYGYTRQAFLTFPLLGAMDPISAKVRLSVQLQKGSLGLAVHEVATPFDEGAVTWSTRPPMGRLLANRTVTGTQRQVVELDVTSAVLAARAEGRTTVTFGLRSTTSGEPILKVNSREASTDRPLLVVQNP